jgi:hypothetical protein
LRLKAFQIVGIVIVACLVAPGRFHFDRVNTVVRPDSNDIDNAASGAFQSNLETDGSAFCLAVQPIPCGPLEVIGQEIVAGALEGSFAIWHQVIARGNGFGISKSRIRKLAQLFQNS